MMNDVIHNAKMKLKEHFMIGNSAVNMSVYVDYQTIQMCIRDRYNTLPLQQFTYGLKQ